MSSQSTPSTDLCPPPPPSPHTKKVMRKRRRALKANKDRIRRICFVCKTSYVIQKLSAPQITSFGSLERSVQEVLPSAREGLKEFCSYFKFDYDTILKPGLEEGTGNDDLIDPEHPPTLPMDHALCLPCMRHLAHLAQLSEDKEVSSLCRMKKLEGLGQLVAITRTRHRDHDLLLSNWPIPRKRIKLAEDVGDSDGDSLYGEEGPWVSFRKGIVKNYLEIFGVPVIYREPSTKKKDKPKKIVDGMEMTSSSSSEDEVTNEYNLSSSSSSSDESSSPSSSSEEKTTEPCNSPEESAKEEKRGPSDNNSGQSTISTELSSASKADKSVPIPSRNGKKPKFINDLAGMEASSDTDSDDSITNHILDLGRVKPKHLAKAKEFKNHIQEIDGRLICDICGVWITLKRISSRENAELKMTMHIFNRHFPKFHKL